MIGDEAALQDDPEAGQDIISDKSTIKDTFENLEAGQFVIGDLTAVTDIFNHSEADKVMIGIPEALQVTRAFQCCLGY